MALYFHSNVKKNFCKNHFLILLKKFQMQVRCKWISWGILDFTKAFCGKMTLVSQKSEQISFILFLTALEQVRFKRSHIKLRGKKTSVLTTTSDSQWIQALALTTQKPKCPRMSRFVKNTEVRFNHHVGKEKAEKSHDSDTGMRKCLNFLN